VGDRPGKNIVDAESIDMIKFWERAPFTDLKGVNSRVAQLRLFEYMRRKNFDLISIGMRSGAMEGPALLGIPTIYIEEEGNEQHERMEKWVGKVPGWSQSKVRSLPTRTGKRFQGAGANVAGSANAMDVPAGEIANEMGKTGAATRQGLAASYNANWGTFLSSFSRTMSVRNIPHKAKQAMSRWHGAYPRAHLLVQRLDVLEANVQRASTNSADQVHDALRPARAHDINMGLGDYVGEVMTVLRPLNATPQAEDNLKAAVRQWRSLWAGKSGFTETDLQGLFESPKIRDDRFAHIRAKHGQLLTSIDSIMNERAGSASARLPTFERQDLNPFINAYIESAGSTIKLRAEFKDLKLAWATGSGGVRQALFDHTRKNADAGGWSKTMFPLVKQLHELLFPKLD